MINILISGIGPRRGGIGSVILNMLKEMDRQKFAPTVLLTYDSLFEEDLKKLNVPVLKICPFGKSIKKYNEELENIFANNQFHYVWINNTSKVDVGIFKLAKKYGVKTISHSHGSASEGKLYKRIISRIWEIFTSRVFYKNLDIAIACSQKSADYFYSKRYMAKHKVHMLLNTIDTKKFEFNEDLRTVVREELGIAKEEKALFAVGRITQVKNPHFMIDLISTLPSAYKLVLVGDGDMREEVNNYISKCNLQDRVIMLGSRNDVNRLINGADVYILPSFNEGYPVAVIEAQASGLPCIISDTITGEVALFDDCKMISLKDINAWKQAILEIENKNREECARKVEELGFDNKAYAVKFEDILLSNL
ncbi:MAG: glycosyltransferase [Clostridia bacterium]|nr:glycosyltransferase [Clostridia bacterium]